MKISAINLSFEEKIAGAMRQAVSEQQPVFLFRHRLASGEVRDVEVRSGPVTIGSQQLLHSIIHDVTEQVRAEAALRHQLDFETLLARISRLFLDLPLEEIDKSIDQIVQLLGEFVDVDRSYLYLVSSDLTTLEAGYEWCAPGVKPELKKTLAMAVESFTWATEQLLTHEVLHVPRIVDLPPEAQVTAALARVGQELIVSLRSPTILEHLCQVTAEVLGCEYSQTYLWDAKEEAYVMAAGWGDPPEQVEAFRFLRFSAQEVQGLADRLQQNDIVQIEVAHRPSFAPGPIEFFELRGVTHVLYMALRQGGKIVGR